MKCLLKKGGFQMSSVQYQFVRLAVDSILSYIEWPVQPECLSQQMLSILNEPFTLDLTTHDSYTA